MIIGIDGVYISHRKEEIHGCVCIHIKDAKKVFVEMSKRDKRRLGTKCFA